jgi:hypothetical protein
MDGDKCPEVFHRKPLKHSGKQKSSAAQEMLFSAMNTNPDPIVLPIIGGASSSKQKNASRVAIKKRVSVMEFSEVATPRSETAPGVYLLFLKEQIKGIIIMIHTYIPLSWVLCARKLTPAA